MFCQYCGKEIPEGLTHCPYCQKLIQPTLVKRDSKKKNPNARIAGIFGVVLLISGLFANFYSTREFIGIQPFGYWITKFPYKDYAFPLLIMGILGLIAGAILSYQERQN